MSALRRANVLVVGATSTIAHHVSTLLAQRDVTLHLAARSVEEAERIGRDLQVRHGASVSWSAFDATDYDTHSALLDAAEDEMGPLDGVFVAVGTLGDQAEAEQHPEHLRHVIEVNYAAVASLLTRAANRLEATGDGWIAALSSVAGDRGRPSNYAYGSAKAGLSAFLEGLRSRLSRSGVHVCTIKPGPVDTKMTFGMDDPPPLMADPERVAADIVAAIDDETDVCYTPPIWRYIMTALRLIPASMFKMLDL
jgi:short-subunit dehydrogenase